MDNKNIFFYTIFLILSIANHTWSTENQSLYVTKIIINDGQKILMSNFQEIDSEPQEMIEAYQTDIVFCKEHYPDVCTKQLELIVEYYQKSTPILEVDSNIAQLFDKSVNNSDLCDDGINPCELRVLPTSIYQGQDTIFFFNLLNIRIFYILDTKLKSDFNLIEPEFDIKKS